MKVIEIFNSIDGEVNHIGQGHPFTFVRLAGCNLACDYCDTSCSQQYSQAKEMSLELILEQVKKIGCPYILITGGEPLLHIKDFSKLVDAFCLHNYEVSVETNGTIQIPKNIFLKASCWKIDFKLQYKQQTEQAWEHNRHLMRKQDWLKIPVWDEESILEAFSIIDSMIKGKAALSAIGIHPKKVFSLLQKHLRFDITLNIQIHKLTGFL